jgi:hypothetical protein
MKKPFNTAPVPVADAIRDGSAVSFRAARRISLAAECYATHGREAETALVMTHTEQAGRVFQYRLISADGCQYYVAPWEVTRDA